MVDYNQRSLISAAECQRSNFNSSYMTIWACFAVFEITLREGQTWHKLSRFEKEKEVPHVTL